MLMRHVQHIVGARLRHELWCHRKGAIVFWSLFAGFGLLASAALAFLGVGDERWAHRCDDGAWQHHCRKLLSPDRPSQTFSTVNGG